jgi:hypothetical protein
VISEPGHPLDGATRATLEPRFGRDLRAVRVHDGSRAAASAAAVSASAYTVGAHVVFGAGHYAPASTEGRSLLAHELAHVLQQSGAAPDRGGRIALAEDRATEAEADRAANRVRSNQDVGPIAAAPQGIARAPAGTPPPPPVPAWLRGVNVIRWVTGDIFEINLTGYGPAYVGPYNQLQPFLSQQGLGEQAHHVVGQEHLSDVPTGYTNDTAPAVGLEDNTHAAVSARITSEQGVLGGRRGGRPIVTRAEIGELYHNVYSQDTGFVELNIISDNVLGVTTARVPVPPADRAGGPTRGGGQPGSGGGPQAAGASTSSHVKIGARVLNSAEQANGSTISEVEVLLSDGLDAVNQSAPPGKALPSRMVLKITQNADGVVVAAESLTGESAGLARALAEQLVAAGTDALTGEAAGAAGAAGGTAKGAAGGLSRASSVLLKGVRLGGTAAFVVITGYQLITASEKQRPRVAATATGGFAVGALESYLVCNLALDLETAGWGIVICGFIVGGATGYVGSEAAGAVYDEATMTRLEKALRDLEKQPLNVRRLFYSLVAQSGAKGLPINEAFVQQYIALVPGNLTDLELYTIAGQLGPLGADTSLGAVLDGLRAALRRLPGRGAPGSSGAAVPRGPIDIFRPIPPLSGSGDPFGVLRGGSAIPLVGAPGPRRIIFSPAPREPRVGVPSDQAPLAPGQLEIELFK